LSHATFAELAGQVADDDGALTRHCAISFDNFISTAQNRWWHLGGELVSDHIGGRGDDWDLCGHSLGCLNAWFAKYDEDIDLCRGKLIDKRINLVDMPYGQKIETAARKKGYPQPP
jgi:hypothetical protein